MGKSSGSMPSAGLGGGMGSSGPMNSGRMQFTGMPGSGGNPGYSSPGFSAAAPSTPTLNTGGGGQLRPSPLPTPSFLGGPLMHPLMQGQGGQASQGGYGYRPGFQVPSQMGYGTPQQMPPFNQGGMIGRIPAPMGGGGNPGYSSPTATSSPQINPAPPIASAPPSGGAGNFAQDMAAYNQWYGKMPTNPQDSLAAANAFSAMNNYAQQGLVKLGANGQYIPTGSSQYGSLQVPMTAAQVNQMGQNPNVGYNIDPNSAANNGGALQNILSALSPGNSMGSAPIQGPSTVNRINPALLNALRGFVR